MQISRRTLLTAAAAIAALPTSSASAKDFYKMSSIAPGTTVYVLQTAFVKTVAEAHPDIEIQVSATGKATRHNLDAAQYKTDFYMSSPSVFHFMSNKQAMFETVEDAPELAKNLRNIFSYPFGSWHFITFADSGIESLMDIKGKRVFLGPPGGGAYNAALAMVEGATGFKADEDFEVVKLGFGPARQAFQDRQTVLHVEPSAAPAPAFQQFALTNKIRLLGLSDNDWTNEQVIEVASVPGRARGTIAPDAYGDNQVNTEAVQTLSTIVGLGTHNKVPEDVIYMMTKAFWENIDEVRKVAPWMSAVTLDNIFLEANMPLHKGAARYYEEVGIEIPDAAKPID